MSVRSFIIFLGIISEVDLQKREKKSPLKKTVTQSWLAIAATQISVNRQLPGRVTSALAPARHI